MQASNSVLGFMNMGWPEITIIIVIFILLFGAKRLPELARGVGKSIKEFKKATSGLEEEVRNAMDEEPKAVAKPSTEKEKAPAEK